MPVSWETVIPEFLKQFVRFGCRDSWSSFGRHEEPRANMVLAVGYAQGECLKVGVVRENC